jgi:uncharacterized protein (TIGR03067 family)
MRNALAACALLCPVAWADAPDKDAVKAELKKLEGVWEGYAVDGKGETPDRGPVHLRLTITDTKISAVDLGNANKDMGTGTYTIDPARPVKEIDATGVVLPGKRERTYPGIYELDGDTLKWCVDNRAKERPTEFRTANGKYLLILKRKK